MGFLRPGVGRKRVPPPRLNRRAPPRNLGEQRLPLPVGSPHAIRRPRRVFRGGAPTSRTLLTVTGMAAALAGAALTALPSTASVGLDGDGYRVGDVRLVARDQGVYAGPEAALVLVEESGSVRAGASTHVNGEPMVSGCKMAAGGRSEQCWFRIGERTLSAEDRLQGGGWERRYGDGQRVRIELMSGRPLPVPFPVGR
jgi:hypothetical protein